MGENAWFVREKVLKMLRYAGVRYDQEKNKENNLEISTPDSKVKLFIIPTNEELEIAKECLTLKTT
ncbi:hypothetical protein CMO92_00980 [Candidatus Woesearchaeota archaeon]|nr:hypothetical protein [Candidatus Woesearchaeota archaeon]